MRKAKWLGLSVMLTMAVSQGCALQSCGAPKCPEGAVLIPAGTFEMGTDRDVGYPGREAPAHKVTLTKPYCIDRTEVTNKAFSDYLKTGKHSWASDFVSTRQNMGRLRPTWPVAFVNWEQAAAYCRSRAGRLPTEAEWEFAARGTDGRVYPWGNDPPTTDHWQLLLPDSQLTVTDVGKHSKGRSFFGLEDMAGNVDEWVSDNCGMYRNAPAVDPVGPSKSESDRKDCRILRGAAWSAVTQDWARATMRDFGDPHHRSEETGFRCAYPTS